MLHREQYNKKSVYTVLNWSNYQHEHITNEVENYALDGALNDATNKKREYRINDSNMDEVGENSIRKKKDTGSLDKARRVMAEFNKEAGKDFRDHPNSDHLKTIKARIEDGFTEEEMIEVINYMVKELKGTVNEPKKWLNPTCLFRPQSFERNLDWAKNADEYKLKG